LRTVMTPSNTGIFSVVQAVMVAESSVDILGDASAEATAAGCAVLVTSWSAPDLAESEIKLCKPASLR